MSVQITDNSAEALAELARAKARALEIIGLKAEATRSGCARWARWKARASRDTGAARCETASHTRWTAIP